MTKTDTRERSGHTNTIPVTETVAAAVLSRQRALSKLSSLLTIYISQNQTLSTHQYPKIHSPHTMASTFLQPTNLPTNSIYTYDTLTLPHFPTLTDTLGFNKHRNIWAKPFHNVALCAISTVWIICGQSRGWRLKPRLLIVTYIVLQLQFSS